MSGAQKVNKNLISAKELARLSHVSYAAINNYTDMGLLEVLTREKRMRMYDRTKTLERLRVISKMLNEGYTLRAMVKLLR
jgi:DNA-binding transcriptional MerR regulator